MQVSCVDTATHSLSWSPRRAAGKNNREMEGEVKKCLDSNSNGSSQNFYRFRKKILFQKVVLNNWINSPGPLWMKKKRKKRAELVRCTEEGQNTLQVIPFLFSPPPSDSLLVLLAMKQRVSSAAAAAASVCVHNGPVVVVLCSVWTRIKENGSERLQMQKIRSPSQLRCNQVPSASSASHPSLFSSPTHAIHKKPLEGNYWSFWWRRWSPFRVVRSSSSCQFCCGCVSFANEWPRFFYVRRNKTITQCPSQNNNYRCDWSAF